MENKGVMLNNLVSIVIAALGIIAFTIFVVKVYTIYSSQEETNTQKTLDFIDAKVSALEEGQNNTFVVQGYKNAENWAVFGWSINDGEAQGKPDKCFGKSCICICRSTSSCQAEGYCKAVKSDNVEARTNLNPPERNLDMNGNLVYSTDHRNYVKLTSNVMGIYIEKKDKTLLIMSAEDEKGVAIQQAPPLQAR